MSVPVEVRLDRLAYLDAAQRGLGHVPRGIPDGEFKAIGEAQGVGIRVDVGHDKAIAVLIEFVREIKRLSPLASFLTTRLMFPAASFCSNSTRASGGFLLEISMDCRYR